MSQVSGVVQRISEKQFNGKKFYSFAMSGVDGWFGTGVKRPPSEGSSIKFNSKTNSRGYLEVDGSIEVLQDGQAGPTPSVGAVTTKVNGGGSSNTGFGDGGKSAYWLGKESRDVTNDAARELGASRNTALTFIDLAIKNEVIKLPAAAKREEFLWTLLDRYTAKLMGKEENAKPEKEPEVAGPDVGDGDNWS